MAYKKGGGSCSLAWRARLGMSWLLMLISEALFKRVGEPMLLDVEQC
jgi:hypothetical protein